MSWNDHPVARWAAILTVASIMLGGGWSVSWYLEDRRIQDQRWYDEDSDWNRQTLDRLADIRSEQHVIVQSLTVLGTQVRELDSRIEVLESEHKMLLTSIVRSEASVREILGRHEGLHRRDR